MTMEMMYFLRPLQAQTNPPTVLQPTPVPPASSQKTPGPPTVAQPVLTPVSKADMQVQDNDDAILSISVAFNIAA